MEQAKKFGAELLELYATDIKKEGDIFQVKIGDEWYPTYAIILAMGATARWLNAPGEINFRNKGISACATCDGPLPIFRNKEIYVVGGGDSAVEESLFLTKFASRVSMIHRRDELRASKILAERAKNHPKIRILWDSVIDGYEGEDFLEKVNIKNLKSNEVESHDVTGLFMAIGHDPATKFLRENSLGVRLDEEGYVRVRDHVHTDVEGIFAAGDVHDTHYRQAVTAAGFGCMAAITAERWLDEKGLNH
jgi:thioredoxin reductase (NADPH)